MSKLDKIREAKELAQEIFEWAKERDNPELLVYSIQALESLMLLEQGWEKRLDENN